MPRKVGGRRRVTLAAEPADLRARLETAEETLRAIRSGEVDALVIAGEGGDTFYTLNSLHEQLEASDLARLALLSVIEDQKVAEEVVRQRLAELETFHNVSIALRNARTRDEALPILLDQTLDTLDTDAGAIMLYHPAQAELRPAVTRGWFRLFDDTPQRSNAGFAGAVFTSGQPRVTPEFERDPLTRRPNKGRVPAGWGGAAVPIFAGESMIGVLLVAVPPGRSLGAEQVSLLESLAEMGGAALHRMSLHADTTRQLERVQSLHKIDSAINSGVDLPLTLDILLEHITSHMGADAAGVLLLDPHSLMLTYAAGRGFHTSTVHGASLRLGEGFAGRAALERRAVWVDDLALGKARPHFAALWAAEGFAAYYAVPLIAKGEVKGVLEVYGRSAFRPEPDWIDFLETLAGQAAIAIDNAQLFRGLRQSNLELKLAYDSTIEGWSRALDLRDKETEGHTLRVTALTEQVARAAGLSEAELVQVRRGALLHDIGKMGVPDSILLKPGKLTDEEWVIMRMHPQYAYDLLVPIEFLRPALDIPYCHHEKWDGTGYPRGLKGEQIPLTARLFAVIDVWDALRSDRPYRPAWPQDKTLEHIRGLAGTHFDPQAVQAILTLLDTESEAAGGADMLPRLLIVDDEENITRTLARSLRDNFQVFTASSGKEALAILTREEIAVILTDQRMPDMTGLELLKQAGQIRRETLGVLISAYSDSAALGATLRLENMRGYVPKPWTLLELRPLLEKVAREHAARGHDGE